MPAGWFFGGLFFILLVFGALTSAISIQEPSIAWLKDEVGWPRKKSALITGLILWLMGFPFVLNGFLAGGLGRKLALLGKMDIIIGQLALPAFGLLSIIAVGWFMKDKGYEEINKNARHRVGRWIMPWMRWTVPIFISFLFLITLARVLQELGKIPRVIPSVPVAEFSPVGITPATVVMMVLVCGLIWGGFIFWTARVLMIERAKARSKDRL